jgi:hypothetical protein
VDIDGFRTLAERPRDAENPSRSARPPHAHRLQTTLTCKAKLRERCGRAEGMAEARAAHLASLEARLATTEAALAEARKGWLERLLEALRGRSPRA